MKKWEIPKLQNLNIEKTECPSWKYYYQCQDNGLIYGCGKQDTLRVQVESYPCSCGGIKNYVSKVWDDDLVCDKCSVS